MSEDQNLPVTIDHTDDMPADFTVIATTPAGMIEAQKSLVGWADKKIAAVGLELQEATEQYDIAVLRKWKNDAWKRQIGKHRARIEYYEKIKAALLAGYYIVPPFPIDVFAIRTNKAKPKAMDTTHEWGDRHDQEAKSLAIGEGDYVSPHPIVETYTDQVAGKDVRHWYATEFADMEFPFKLARSEIRDATQAAIALGIFDRLGVLPRMRSPDPMVCGQIIVPGQSSYARGDSVKCVTFFVAWWLDAMENGRAAFLRLGRNIS